MYTQRSIANFGGLAKTHFEDWESGTQQKTPAGQRRQVFGSLLHFVHQLMVDHKTIPLVLQKDQLTYGSRNEQGLWNQVVLDLFQNFSNRHFVHIVFAVGRQTGVPMDGLVSG